MSWWYRAIAYDSVTCLWKEEHEEDEYGHGEDCQEPEYGFPSEVLTQETSYDGW